MTTNTYATDKLLKHCGIELSVVPITAADSLRTAVLASCERADRAHEFVAKMKAGEDIGANELVYSINCQIFDKALEGSIEYKVVRHLLGARKGSLALNEEKDLPPKIIYYVDGTEEVLDDYLSLSSYMQATALYLIETYTKAGYSVSDVPCLCSGKPSSRGASIGMSFSGGASPSKDLPTFSAEEMTAFCMSENKLSFEMYIAWGDEALVSSLSNLESMSQYKSFAAGVSLEDILA